MKHLLSLVILAISHLATSAQNTVTDSSATCIAYWKKGEEKVFLINHKKEKLKDGVRQSGEDIHYEAHLTVKDSSAAGYTIEWTNRNYSSPTNNPMVKGMNFLYNDLHFLYKTTEAGAFVELVNWEEVRDFYVNLAALSVPRDNDTAQEIMNKTKAMFSSREAVEAAMIPEIQLLHLPYGYEFSTQKQVGETTLPNLFGGDPIPALQTIRITHLDPEAYTLAMTQEIDRANASAFLKDMFQRLGVTNTASTEEINRVLQSFEISDSREFTVGVQTGWLSQVWYQKVVKADTMKQLESYRIAEKK